MGAICQCPEGISEDECSDKSTCQCRVDEVAVNLGFQQIQCMKKGKRKSINQVIHVHYLA